MDSSGATRDVLSRDTRAILDVAVALAAPFDLVTMLAAVVDAAKQVLNAERGSVWLFDEAADELILDVGTNMDPVRVPAGVGLVGTCARTRGIINVPDCYSDRRFDPAVDRRSGYRTRCMLTLPLVDHRDTLVGVMQVLNKCDGVFDAEDESLAAVLAAQCAVALQRVRMTAAAMEGERLRHELDMAKIVQTGTLPAEMPRVHGYDAFGTCYPADQTGGDTFDLWLVNRQLGVLLADATGHGIAPALSVTQMQAMIRMALRLGATLETAMIEVNNQLAEWLPSDRFITAFLGVVDPLEHRITFHSAGQGPILHFKAADTSCALHRPTGSPLGAIRLARMRPAVTFALAPGDILLLLSDGIFEARNAAGEEFGVARVQTLIAGICDRSAAAMAAELWDAMRSFLAGAPQEDDITIVIVKREAWIERAFPRAIDALPDVVAFTGETFAAQQIARELRWDVDFAIEELFTNMVKYGTSGADIGVGLRKVPGGVEVTLVDPDSERYDVTAAPEVDIHAPIEQRRPGGLGIHLTRRVVEDLRYAYAAESRESRITFRKTSRPGSGSATLVKGGH